MATLPSTAASTEVGLELGKAIADRLGLDPERADQEWSAIQGQSNTVWVRISMVARMPESEYNELLQVAQIRADRKAAERRARRAAR